MQTELWIYGIHHVRPHPGTYEDLQQFSLDADVVVLFVHGHATAAAVERRQSWVVSLAPREVPWWFSWAVY